MFYLAFIGNKVLNAKRLVFTLSDDSKAYYQLDGEHHPVMRMTDDGLTVETDRYTFMQIREWHISDEDAPAGIESAAIGQDEKNETVRIYSADGKLLQTTDLKDLPAGTYVIRNGQSTLKILKK